MTSTTSYLGAADRALDWIGSHLQEDGSFGPGADDLGCYYKAPYAFALAGRVLEAHRILTYIQRRFMSSDGDFSTSADAKSENAAFEEYWAYPNGWIALGAHRIGRFDFSYPAWHYLRSFSEPTTGGFRTGASGRSSHGVIDALTTAHLGLLCLYLGEVQRARAAGRWLAALLGMQPDLQRGFYLRVASDGALVQNFPDGAAAFHVVRAHEPNQAYFMVGYPIGFLGKLFQATGDKSHLDTARHYLDFALGCTGNLRSFYFSHKVAWGAAVVAAIIADRTAADLATEIADYLISIQDPEGSWLSGQPPYDQYDQTAEISIWLREITVGLDAARHSLG